MINEFEGDVVLVVFGVFLELFDYVECVVVVVVGMFEVVVELNWEWEEDGIVEWWCSVGVDGLAIWIGIHTGKVVVGNVGSEVRTKYAVIGDIVNIVFCVEYFNKEFNISFLIMVTMHEVLVEVHSVQDMGVH